MVRSLRSKGHIKWQKLLYRGDGFKVSMSTKVYSNHFDAGYRSDQCTTPTLHLQGYTHLQEIKERKSPRLRKLLAVSSCAPLNGAHNIKKDGSDNMNSVFIVEQHGIIFMKLKKKTLASTCAPVTGYNHCIKLNSEIIDLKKKLHEKEKELEKLQSQLEGSNVQKKKQSNSALSYSQVKDDDKMLNFYTKLQNKNI